MASNDSFQVSFNSDTSDSEDSDDSTRQVETQGDTGNTRQGETHDVIKTSDHGETPDVINSSDQGEIQIGIKDITQGGTKGIALRNDEMNTHMTESSTLSTDHQGETFTFTLNSHSELSESTMSQSTASESTFSENVVSQSTVSESTVTQSTASESTVSENVVSESNMSANFVSESTESKSNVSQSIPSDSTMSDSIQDDTDPTSVSGTLKAMSCDTHQQSTSVTVTSDDQEQQHNDIVAQTVDLTHTNQLHENSIHKEKRKETLENSMLKDLGETSNLLDNSCESKRICVSIRTEEDSNKKQDKISRELGGVEAGCCSELSVGGGSGEGQVLSTIEEEKRAIVEQGVHTDLHTQAEASYSTKHRVMEESATPQQGHRSNPAEYRHDFSDPQQYPIENRSRFNDSETAVSTRSHDQSESFRKNGDVRVLCTEDGSRSLEKTTTYIAGDRESTDDLIKRILAEARGEVYSPARQSSREQRSEESEERRPEERSALQDWTEEYGSNRSVRDRKFTSMDESIESAAPRHRYGQEEYSNKSVQDRKFVSMDESMESMESTNRPRYGQEDYAEPLTQRRGQRTDLYSDRYSDPFDRDSQTSSGYTPRHFRSNMMQKQQAVLQQDEWSDDEENVFHRQPQVEYIPDEEFIPQKAEDTDRVVQEKTEGIRDVVDKQSSVLQQLKSASDSFEEITAEIKELKQHFLDSQMRRSMILDEIEHEKMMMEQADHEGGAKPGYQPRSRGIERNRYTHTEDTEFGEYKPIQPTRQVTLDKELEADRLGRGGLTGLAVGSSSPLDSFRSKFSEKYQTALTGSAFTNSYGAEKTNKYRSLYDNDDESFTNSYDIDKTNKYQSLYDEEPASRSRGGRHTLTRSYGAMDDSGDTDEPSYRSPNLPSYRKYDYEKKDYSSSDYSRPSRSLYTGGATSSTSSRYSSLPRSKTIDYSSSTSSTRSYQAAPEPAFSSRFLDKVREKKSSGETLSRGAKPFTSRFLGKSFDTGSTFPRPTRTKTEDVSKHNGNSETASTGE